MCVFVCILCLFTSFTSLFDGAEIYQYDQIGGHVYIVHVYICDVHLYVDINFYMYMKIGWQYRIMLKCHKTLSILLL